MRITATLAVKASAVLAVGALALTACTNASETGAGAQAGSSGSASASFDPSTLKKDDSLASQVPAALKSKGTLVIGTTPTYAPGEFLGGADNHTPMGYDIDFAKAVASTLGLKLDVESADFPSILPSLGSKFDLGIASFGITKERLKAVNFVSYFSAGTSWAVQKGNPKKFSVDDICGRSIGVQTGTIQEAPDIRDRNDKCVAEGKKPIDIVSLKTQAEVTTRLANGAIDAMAADSPVIGYAITQTNGTLEKAGSTYNTVTEGIAVAKNDTGLTDLVQKVMSKLMADGTYKKILDNWNVADSGISKSEVNPTAS
jgi:polar amino acid transport system substrate-binding protein